MADFSNNNRGKDGWHEDWEDETFPPELNEDPWADLPDDYYDNFDEPDDLDEDWDVEQFYPDDYGDDADALASAGHGMDEDYWFEVDFDDYYQGDDW